MATNGVRCGRVQGSLFTTETEGLSQKSGAHSSILCESVAKDPMGLQWKTAESRPGGLGSVSEAEESASGIQEMTATGKAQTGTPLQKQKPIHPSSFPLLPSR